MDTSTVLCRQGSIEDFDRLHWSWNKPSTTKDIFMNRIEHDVQEIWVAEYKNMLIGELHLIWISEDKDEANGINRAYLFSYRVHPDYQGKGIGSRLMKKVLHRILEKGFNEVTIGVEQAEKQLVQMYNAWGFCNFIKTKVIDHHGFDSQGNPKKIPPYNLYLKSLS
ncbi:GNAT family N-acetyltransferase [Paenibacillus thermotolerans]|uniref:GNAT family N-acetyltransferase n=1 Tax=Paenibacillus thermotolerans TaxID=3027807 RepID=UPI002367A452|nr:MULTISPECIES: GNAT family N-acetyltransferase [unclassified Paenibacillus]